MPFTSPNYTQMPNDLLGSPIRGGKWKLGTMAEMGSAELRVTLVLCRLTLGFHSKTARISIRRIARAAGIAPSTAQQGLFEAEQRGTVVRFSSNGVNQWQLNAPWLEPGWMCKICGTEYADCATAPPHRHHIVPKEHGGRDKPSNLYTLCPRCHQAVHQRINELLQGHGPSESLFRQALDEVIGVSDSDTPVPKPDTSVLIADTPSKKETVKETVLLPVPSAQGTDYFSETEELEYVEVGEDEAQVRPNWVIPENAFQRQILAVCNAKWFKPKQKTLVKKLAKCLEIGAVLSEAACLHRCLDELKGCETFPERPVAVPSSWLRWRSDHAKSHRWSVQGFINSLFDRDALARHCQVMLKKAGVKTSAADEVVPEGMVRVLSEKGVSLITKEEAERRIV